MKKGGCLSNLIYKINILVALLLALTLFVPYISPLKFPNLSLASLAVPPLFILNVLFLIYWLFSRWRRILLSAIVIALAIYQFGTVFKYTSEGDSSAYRNKLSILTHNVRLFNAYEKDVNTTEVADTYKDLLEKFDPEVLIVQEYYKPNNIDLDAYPFSFIHFKSNHKLGHAIFSKHPIVNSGAFDFSKTSNNSIYADIATGTDTIRIYNLHLQSMGILPNVEYLQEGDKDRLRYRMVNTFKAQATQVDKILRHTNTSPHPVVLSGDLNNTQFSYIYRKLSESRKDAFNEKGNGLGTTFWFDFYPMRIDYVLLPLDFDVISFVTSSETISDHNALFTTLGWPSKNM